MCCDDGGYKEGGIKTRGDNSYSMQTRASLDDGGRRNSTAAMWPQSRVTGLRHEN